MTEQESQQLFHELKVEFATLTAAVVHMQHDVGEIKTDLREQFVTQKEFIALSKTVDGKVGNDRFDPVRTIVYALVGLLGVTVVGALLRLVIIG